MKTLKIHFTYQCSAQCDHCHLRASRRASPVIDHELAMTVVRDLHRIQGLDYVVVLGGEPGLFREELYRLLREIAGLGVGTRVETNACWATDEGAARAFLAPLAEIGSSVMVSADSFHEPFVPIDNVERALRALAALGIPHSLAVSWLDPDAKTHPADVRTTEIVEKLERRLGELPSLESSPVYFKGRAAHELAHLVSAGRGIPREVCDRVFWWIDSEQATTDFLGLTPDGHLSKECGIAIGNMNTTSVEAVLESFDAMNHPILSTLIDRGPVGLAEEAAKLGYVLDGDYADRCHLCQEAREVLREKYPEHLTPDQQYVENGKR